MLDSETKRKVTNWANEARSISVQITDSAVARRMQAKINEIEQILKVRAG